MEINELLNSIQIEVGALRLLCEDLKLRVTVLEKTVIVGHPGSLPLAEVVRNLTNTVNNYIEQKNKEEEDRKKEEVQREKEKREQRNRWIILGASIGIPILLTIIGQAVYFYFEIVPLIDPLLAGK